MTTNKQCSVEGCLRKYSCKGYCQVHYYRVQRTGEPGSVETRRPKLSCTVVGCEDKHKSNGYCSKHHTRWMKYGDPLIQKHASPTKTGRYTTDEGYVRLYGYKDHPNAQAKGCILEHILIMSEHLGRPLTKGENVHHINGQRDDNRIENLELWSKTQPAGQRVEDKIAWAIEFLRIYQPEALLDRRR